MLGRGVQFLDGILGNGGRAALAGFSATLVGIGLGRFTYGPLLPALVSQGWFDIVDAGYLGAANFAGYFAGALFAARLPTLASTGALLRGSMLAAAICFFACATPAPFAWFCIWRFLSGFSGAVLMVLAAPAFLSVVTAQMRGRVAGVIFSGVGVGIVASAVLVPLLFA
jgi:MFS family permease